MFFTREDINKIYQALLKLGIKDSKLPETNDVKIDDTLAIVQDGKNKQINVREFLNQISLWKREDFINITDKYKKSHITLVEAIQAIPIVQRKEGLVITFLDNENNWRIYQFRGSLLQFNNETLWTDLYDFSPYIIDSILPDEEDITQSAIDEQGNTYLSLKGREYNPSEFSGKGYKILRKNIIEIEDENSNKVKKNILTQDMINNPNTIYEIRYDFDLNGKTINIREGCVLKFVGGQLKNGILACNNSEIIQTQGCFKNIKFNGLIANEIYASSFIETGIVTGLQDMFNSCIYDINFIIDVSFTIDKTIYIKNARRVQYKFTKNLYTTIDDGSPCFMFEDISTVTVDGLKIDVKNLPSGKNNLNYIGIQAVKNVQISTFKNIDIRKSEIGLQIGKDNVKTSGYLINVDNIIVYNSNIGIQVNKGLDSSWINGCVFRITDISDNNIGLDCQIGKGNTILCTNTEIGRNNIGIKISSGEYNIFGYQWNEQPKSKSIYLSGGITRFIGLTGINRPNSIYIEKNAVCIFDDVNELNIKRNCTDLTNLLSDIKFKNSYDNKIYDNILNFEYTAHSTLQFAERGELKSSLLLNKKGEIVKHQPYDIPFKSIEDFSIVFKFNLNGDLSLKKPFQNSLFSFRFTQAKQTSGEFYMIVLRPFLYFNVEGENKMISIIQIHKYPEDVTIVNKELRGVFDKERGVLSAAISYDSKSGKIFDQYGNTVDLDISSIYQFNENPYNMEVYGENIIDENILVGLESLSIYNKCLSCNELIDLIRNPVYKEPLNIGTTEQRPKGVNVGFIYKDNTINKLIIWNGTEWANMDGTAL